uniref:Uncharacterized protein n=1 Tax=Chromera velia CCMP2878 TaxID=1169474 RepID=A0A0G4FAT8_9ALVE|eukprot:Cvel_16059.t1-p1 / transcript=Cvel_16059.t1 / gene=Cvel_16059 / organism=Chromera_velia_CCMP2878 / gene_product=hypothetical protein / transcript_product=hypothetical protein / location=Cvel_scaffold1220:44048-45838(+) / protein_length=273 / sequence_SO=supercontig / SO=protein_coding / is_pseudo=false
MASLHSVPTSSSVVPSEDNGRYTPLRCPSDSSHTKPNVDLPQPQTAGPSSTAQSVVSSQLPLTMVMSPYLLTGPGDRVLFNHPEKQRDKREDLWEDAIIKQRYGGHVYTIQLFRIQHSMLAHIRCLRPSSKTSPPASCSSLPHPLNLPYPPSSSPSDSQPSPPLLPHASSAIPSALSEPTLGELPSIHDFHQGEMIIWEVPKTQRRFLGKVVGIDKKTELFEVHTWGSLRHGALRNRTFAPMWRRPTGHRVQYQYQQPPSHNPNICIIALDEI